jgi:hypothetical protein
MHLILNIGTASILTPDFMLSLTLVRAPGRK